MFPQDLATVLDYLTLALRRPAAGGEGALANPPSGAVMFALSLLLVLAPPAFRDQIASAWDHPLISSAEMVERLADHSATIRVTESPMLLRWPGVATVTIDGQAVTSQRLAPDLVSVAVAAGEHRVEVGREAPASDDAVAPGALTASEFETLAAAAKPGDTLTIPDGLYRGWKATVKTSGTAEAPLTIRAATPGGAIFTGDSSLTIAASQVVVHGLRFEQAGPNTAVAIVEGSGCRISQCLFIECGNPQSSFYHVVSTMGNGEANRVDHNYFASARSMSCGVRIREGSSPKRQRIDHNVFRDIVRYWVNGQENVQLGQNQRGKTGEERPDALVEQNLFDHAWGDGEIISSKSTGNTIRHNLASWCYRAAFTLRGGDLARFEGNAMVGGGGGLRVMGQRHTIVNNFFAGLGEPAIYFETGSVDGTNQVASADTLVAHNTFVDCPAAFGAMATTEARPHAPERLRVLNNLVLGSPGEPVRLEAAQDVALARLVNLPAPQTELAAAQRYAAWLSGEAAVPAEAIDRGQAIDGLSDDLLGRPRTGQPDVGCLEAGAGPARVKLPALGAPPLLDPAIYRGRVLEQWPAGTQAGTLNAAPPAKAVVSWSWHPDSYASTGSLTIGGYRLDWGGADKDGLPLGLVQLHRGDALVATAANLVHYRLDFIYQPWMGRTINETKEPAATDWYRFQMVKDGGRIYVTMVSDKMRRELPILAWRDRTADPSSGPLAIGGDGPGQFGEVVLYSFDYAGGRRPDQPGPLRAEVVAGRVRLTWTEAPRDAGAVTYRIVATAPGQAAPRAVVAGVAGTTYDDFGAAAGQRCGYTLVAENRFGLLSEPVAAEVTAAADGPFTALIEAAAGRLEPPFTAGIDEYGVSHVAPGNPTAAMQGAPAEGIAEYRVTLPAAAEVMVYGLVTAPDDGHDSLYLAIDDGEYAVWYIGVHATWAWSKAAQVKLGAGEHVLRVKHREPGTRLAKLVVTADRTLPPAP